MEPSPTHELVEVTGPDSVSFLDGLLSQAIAPMAVGEVRRSFLLAPNGKLRAILWVRRNGEGADLVADAGFGSRVVDDLTRFKLRVEVEIGPAAVPLFTGLESTSDALLTVPLGDSSRWLTTEPVGAAEPSDLDALRVEAGEPVMGIDVDDSTIPQETGLVPEAVDFTKGCYLGQELVARIDSRGHVNRRLAQVRFDEGTPPPGATVRGSDGDAGTLTTVASGRGMGLVRREVGDGETVEVTWSDRSVRGHLVDFREFAAR